MFCFYIFEAWLKDWHAFLLEFRWLSSWTLNSEDRPKTLLYKPESLLFLKGLSSHLVSKWQGLLIYTTVKKSKLWSCGIAHLFFIPYHHTLLPIHFGGTCITSFFKDSFNLGLAKQWWKQVKYLKLHLAEMEKHWPC